MAYCGCGTCCSKLTWCSAILLLLAAAAGLAAGLYVTVPCASKLNVCMKSPEAGTSSNQCWTNFWQCTAAGKAGGLYFFLAVAGAACFFLSLISCCCFCCQRRPGAPPKVKKGKKGKQDQFMSSSATDAPAQASAPTASDSAPYSDQYAAYSPYPEPNVKPSVAHV
jgi:hypothetical protein